MSLTKSETATNEHMASVASLSIEQQLQLAAVRFGGSLESQVTAAAAAVLIARMVQLNEADQADLFACVKDLASNMSEGDVEDTMTTILEILEPNRAERSVVDIAEVDKLHSRSEHERWLVWISQKLKTLREDRGMTQIQLALEAGLQQSHISRLEGGMHSPSMKTLQKLADALKIDIGTLNLLSSQ